MKKGVLIEVIVGIVVIVIIGYFVINKSNSIITNCESEKCFIEKFKGCNSATFTSKLTENTVYYYEIIGQKQGFCEVKSKFNKNPNLDWVGKEMICLYNNSKDFKVAIQDMDKCSGELYDLMIGKIQTNYSAQPSTSEISPVAPQNYLLELDIRIPKDIYKVGESLEGSEYYLKYTGQAFKGMILYTESRNSINSTSFVRGTIKGGDFDNPETLPGLKVSMYSLDSQGNINPFFYPGIYTYTISVYDCKSIEDTLITQNCGKDVQHIAKKVFDEVIPLKTKSKTITVVQ